MGINDCRKWRSKEEFEDERLKQIIENDYENPEDIDYPGRDYIEANIEEIRERKKEAREIIREYFGDDISFAKGKEERIAWSIRLRDSDEDLEWIKNGWMWIDKDDGNVYYSEEGRKRFQENRNKLEGR